jgi:hypothetical protein
VRQLPPPDDKAALDRKATRLVGGAMLGFGLLALLPAGVMLADVVFGNSNVIALRSLMCSLVIGLPLTGAGLMRLLRPAAH